MILPIGHEGDSVRRIPWVTIGIIALCLIFHIVISGQHKKVFTELLEHGPPFSEYFRERPYLELDPNLEKLLFPTPLQKQALKEFRDKYREDLPSDSILEMEQDEFNVLCRNLKRVLDNIPFWKWGFTPARKSLKTSITSMFVHAGWWHLILNMLFLYVLAPFIEDVWGKPIFIVFYLLMGIMSALMHGMHYPQSMAPLVGASGAISGVMGAFLVRFWNTNIRFVFLLIYIPTGTFSAPAWLMLPLYVIKEYFNARFMDSLQAYGYGGSGVAHWVHFWGFIFGFVVALGIKFLKVEEKFLAPKIEAKTTFVNESLQSHEKAMELLAEGNAEEAYSMLLEAAQKDPYYNDIIEALWNVGGELERLETVAPYLTRLVEKEIRTGQLDAALKHYKPLKHHVPDVRIAPSSKIALLEQMVKQEEYQESEAFGLELGKEINVSLPPGLLVNYCNSMALIDLELNHTNAQPFIEMALGHPEIPESGKEELKKRLFEKRRPGQGESIPVSGSSVGAAVAAAGLGAVQFSRAPGQSAPPPPAAAPPPIPEPQITLDLPSEPPPAPDPDVLARPGEITLSLDLEDDDQPVPPPPIEIPSSPMQVPPPVQTPPPPVPEPSPAAPAPAQPAPTNLTPPAPPASSGTLEREIESAMVRPPAAEKAVKKELSPNKAVPMGVKEGRLAMNVDKVGQRALPLQKIKAISAAKIAPPAQGAFLLIDLFLDNPLAPTGDAIAGVVKIRTLRILSTEFNPQSFIPNTKSLGEAFRAFTTGLLKMSGAVPIPDAASVQLQKMATFSSIEEYEKSLPV
jgi:membrane associated rhomboid family serine protease